MKLNNKHKLLYRIGVFSLFVMICFPSCFSDLREPWQENGMAPIYVSPTNFDLIYSSSPQPSEDQGSFVEEGNYIYVNERFKGIHVFDNSDPANPEKKFFWNIPGNSEFTIDGNYLYADNSRHLLTIDISNPAEIKFISYIEDVYTVNMENDNYPENYTGRFQCADFSKGIVVDWELRLLDSPKCFR